jgi:hypothetical protein
MYSMSIHCSQVLNTAYVVMSLVETDDEGTQTIIARAVTQEGRFSALDEDPLWIFTQHVSMAVVKCLSSAENEVWNYYFKDERLDGGGRAGPGQQEPGAERPR